MGIFGSGQKGPTKINGVSINQSKQGYAIPALMGENKIQQSIIWLDGLHGIKDSQGGKGGGKGGSEELYTADVIAALCNGPVSYIGGVWSGQSWLSTQTTSESTVLTSTVYNPIFSTLFSSDSGVSAATTFSGTYNDFGAPTSTTLSGTDATPLKIVPYGTTLASGQYSINPTTNAYNFSNADVSAGITVTINYQYSMQEFLAQENDLITSSLVVYPGSPWSPQKDHGVVYYNNLNSLDGKALTPVTTTPTVAGTYKFTSRSNNTPEYQFAPGDIGNEVTISWGYENLSAVSSPADTLLNFELFTGTQGQSVAPYLLTGYSHSDNGVTYFNPAFPSEALGYTNTAYVLYYPMELGSSAELQNNVFEVLTPHAFGGGIVDCNPVTCIYNVLTNTVWGLGSGVTPFPLAAIDNSSQGTWGYTSPTGGVRTTASTAWNWFAAQNFFISPVIDSQDSASSLIGKWLEAGMCAAFMSEGLFKLVPYGDTSAAGNGCTWVAPSSYVVALDDTCFIAKNGDDPVKIERSAWQDANNKIQVQYKNRANQYSDDIVQESDQAAINRYGLRVEDTQDWDFITTLASATFAANMRLKRSVNTRNTYTFTLPYTYSYLEPMDIVTISTTSMWAAGMNNSLGVINLPVRITKIVDDAKNGLEITCEDYAYGTHKPVLYNKGVSSSDTTVNQYASPANSAVVMFEATSRLTQYQGNQIWIGAAGVNTEWGGCVIWISADGASYTQLGTITEGARLGTLANALPIGSAVDTVNSLVVNVADNCGTLYAGTANDAQQNNTLCFVDGELLSYSACALTGQDQYTMNTYICRGAMGSNIAAHAAGSLFLRLDDSIYKYTYDPQWLGKTLYFKFQSINSFNNCPQDLSTLTAVPYTVSGAGPGTIDASNGLVTANSVVYPTSGSNLVMTVASLMPAQAGADKTSLNTAANISGQGALATSSNVSLSSSQVLMKGSVPPVLTSGFTYTATTANITWAWPQSTAIYRADGTVTTIGNGSQLITGLSTGGTYYFFPVWNEAASALQWVNSSNVSFPNVVGYTGNGSNGYVSTTNAVSTTTTTSFSVECWINTTSSAVVPLVCLSSPEAIGTTSNCAIQAWLSNGTAEICTATGANTGAAVTLSLSNGTFADGQTHHIVITATTGTNGVNLYKDGVLAASGTLSSGIYALSGMYWQIGALAGKTGFTYSTSQYSPTNTVMSDVAIYYNTVLSATQVANHYQTMLNQGISTYYGTVVGDLPTYWWKLNETSGTTAAEMIANNTGTYKGGVTLNQRVSVFKAAGNPAIAWPATTYLTAQASNLQGVIPLTNGAISAVATTGSGGAGGSGGSGGGGGCFSPNTRVVTKRGNVRFNDLTTNDYVKTASGEWIKVAQVLVHKWTENMLDMGNGELVTYKHSILDSDRWEKACFLFGSEQAYNGNVYNLVTDTDEPEEISYNPLTKHSYTLANGLVVHNGPSTK